MKSELHLPTEPTSSLKSHHLQKSDPPQTISNIMPAVNSSKPAHQPITDSMEFNSRTIRTHGNVSILKPNSSNFSDSLVSSVVYIIQMY